MAEKENKKVEETKKVTFKKYLILALIFALGIGLTLYFCKWYKVYDEYQKQTPVIRGTLVSEITNEDLEHYILENPTSVIYMCTSQDMVCRNYEKDLKKYVEEESLQETIVYLNLTDIDQKTFVKDFNSKYNYKVKLTKSYPAIVIFEDGKIHNILQGKKDEKLTISKTKQFIEMNKIGE